MTTIYKICSQSVWTVAEGTGEFMGSPADAADGFIHFSTAEQVRETAAKHFAGQDDLLLIAVNSEVLEGVLRWEPSRGGALFPHLYAPLPVKAALWVKPLPLEADGSHSFPDLEA